MHVEVSDRAHRRSRRWRAAPRCSSEPLAREEAERIAPLLKALADPVRLRLLSLVASHADGEACVCDLNDAFDLSQPTISHHLKVLHEVGLLDRSKRGVWVYYRVAPRGAGRPGRPARRRGRVIAGSRRRAVAELVGTAFLVVAVVGSGIAATRLSPDDVGLQLLENSLVTGAALVALILALQPVSASFNPVVTLVERALGRDRPARGGRVLVAAQVVGGVLGAVLANLMFDLDAVTLSTHERSGAGLWLGEVVATLGLVLVVFGSLRAGAADTVAFAVGGYITAAYWFTSSTSFANPAVTVARMLSDTFAGIAPASVPVFVLMQLVGGALALGLVRVLFDPHPTQEVADASTRPTDPPSCSSACTTPAARRWPPATSQHLAGDRIEVLSAGSQPADRVNPVAVAGDGRGGHRHRRRASRRCSPRRGAGLRRRGHHGLRRRVPVLPRASATRTGSSTTRPARASRPSARSATRSAAGSSSWSTSCSELPADAGDPVRSP